MQVKKKDFQLAGDRMSILAHDIDAIVATAAFECDSLRMGVIESSSSDIAVEIEIKEGISDRLSYAFGNLFGGADENARIALVLTETSPRSHGGAWAAAANRFCAENVAGVLVLEKDRAMTDMSGTSRFLDRIPDTLWKAGMPIFYDESGILHDYAIGSHVLEHDRRLSFEDLECMLSLDGLASIGAWAKGMFPVYDVTGTDEKLKYVKKISDYELNQTAGACRRALSDVNCWRPSWSHEKWSDIDSIVLLLEIAASGSIDHSDLTFLTFIGNLEVPEEVPYAVKLDRASSKELGRIGEFRKNVVGVSRLIAATLQKYHVTFNPTYKDNFILSAEELRDLLDAFGIAHKIQALHAGVPLEDIEI
jgi:hypothetical protein